MTANHCIYELLPPTEHEHREAAKMADAVVGPLLGRLQELAMSEVRAMVGVNDAIRTLRDKLMWMQAFLRDAEPRRRVQNDELIRVWLQQTRDTVFDAEDAVDQYFLQVDLSRYPSWTHAVLKFFAGLTTQVRVRHDLSNRIISINTRLEAIIKNRDRYKMDDIAAEPIMTWRPSTAIFSTAAEKLDDFVLPLVGRGEQLKQLEEALSKETESPLVIYVTGKSGVGKTKLVTNMYEEHWTTDHFEVQEWVSFAPNLSASNIMKLILERLREANVTGSKVEVRKELKEELKEKIYLLVIDGEVSSTEWNCIIPYLPSDKKESRVVRITQTTKPELPSAPFQHTSIVLDHFKEKAACTELFLKTLLVEEKGEKYKEDMFTAVRNDYHEDIFNITDGLPLAVVLLSGLMRTKEYPGEWSRVFKHLNLETNQWKRLDSILSVCFDDLPHDLKCCFLYFAALPVNTLIRERSLVCMWMAEGFLRPKEGKTMEKVGDQYLKELVARRLVNLAPVEHAVPGDERVAVQSKVHAFLLLEAQEASFVEIHSGDDIPTLSTARRLSLQNHRDKYAALANPLPKLRSILSDFEKEEATKEEDEGATTMEKKPNTQLNLACLHHRSRRKGGDPKERIKSSVRQLLQGSKFLRVISLNGLDIGDKLPSEIGDVVHLQYLGITSCSLKEIPTSIGNLAGLQTLDVRDTGVTTLPDEFWRIRTLRHVFGYLVLPKRVGHLEHLQTLQSIKPDDADGWDKKTLAKMNRLLSLYIWGLSATPTNMHALSAVCTLKYLVDLTIQGETITSNLFTGSNLPRLQVMELEGKLVAPVQVQPPDGSSSLQQEIRFHLPNLIELSLEKTEVSQDFIDKLGKLPFLATLSLYPGSYKEERLVFACGFPSLKELTLDVELKSIVMRQNALPQLVDLEVFIHFPDELCAEIHGDRPNLLEQMKQNDVPCVTKPIQAEGPSNNKGSY